MSKLIAGTARANITPPVGMLMSGYASRRTPAVGIHDELHTVVIYLNDSKTEAAIVTVDLIMNGDQGVARVREACAAATGVPAENILVTFAHNHAGPQINLQDSPDDGLKQAYATVVVHKIAGALSEAKANAVPVRVGHGQQDCHFGKNRREHKPDGTIAIGFNPDGPRSSTVNVLRMDRLDTGQPLSVLFSYACHGTVMRADNLLYSAEYSGLAKAFVDQQFPTALSSFAAFCSADIDPWPHGDFEKCERYGKELGCAVTQAVLDTEDMTEDVGIAVASQRFKMQLEKLPSLDQAKERLAKAQADAQEKLEEARKAADGKPVDEDRALDWFTRRNLQGAEDLVKALESGETVLGVSGEIQAIAIGDFAIVGMPGEIFVKIGLEIAEKSPFARTIAISHTNGSIGYVPTADQVPLGGYEIERARARKYGIFIAPDSDQVLIDGSLAALQKCYDALNG